MLFFDSVNFHVITHLTFYKFHVIWSDNNNLVLVSLYGWDVDLQTQASGVSHLPLLPTG